MGIFDRLERQALRGDVSWEAWPPEAGSDFWYGPAEAGSASLADFPVSAERAKRASAVFACNSLIAETLASLPCVLYRRLDNGGKEKARDDRRYRTLRYRTNVRQAPINFFGDGQMHVGMRGNCYAKIRDDGRVCELLPRHPTHTQVEELSSGRLRYRFYDPKTGQTETLLQDEVLHVRDLSDDGIVGQARVALAREAVAVAMAGEAFVARFFKYDAAGRIVFSSAGDGGGPEKRKEFLAEMRRQYSGWDNRGKPMLAWNGMKVEELGKQTSEGFIIDPRNFQIADIARFWRVPLFMIGLEEKSTTWGSGIEQQVQGFVDFTIKTWADRWSQALLLSLFDEAEQEEFFIEFLFADLVRGDLLARMQAYDIALRNGIYNPNEARLRENEGPREGGDQYRDPTAVGAAAHLPTPGSMESMPEQAAGIPPALLADAAARIAERELREVVARAAKAHEDHAKWVAWLQTYYLEHRHHVTRVMGPLIEAFGLEPSVLGLLADRVQDTALRALVAGVPEHWLDQRRTEVALILEETLRASAAISRAA